MSKQNITNIVRSRYRILYALFFGAIGLFWGVVSVLIVVNNIRNADPLHAWALWMIIVVSNLALWLYILNVPLRYVVIDREQGCATYYSLFRPFGRRFFFRDFTGICTTTDNAQFESGYGVHLVDGRHIRRLMSCALYRNYPELRQAIPLPEIKHRLTMWESLMLFITGHIEVPERWGKVTKRERKRNG
jgi:hypothetical protein